MQLSVCNGSHVVMIAMNLGNIAVLNINGTDYRCIITRSIIEPINLLKNDDLSDLFCIKEE